MIRSVGIDLHQRQHRAHCLDERAQPCDSFSFQTTPEGLDTFEEHIFHDGSNPVIVLEPAGLPWLMVAVYQAGDIDRRWDPQLAAVYYREMVYHGKNHNCPCSSSAFSSHILNE